MADSIKAVRTDMNKLVDALRVEFFAELEALRSEMKQLGTTIEVMPLPSKPKRPWGVPTDKMLGKLVGLGYYKTFADARNAKLTFEGARDLISEHEKGQKNEQPDVQGPKAPTIFCGNCKQKHFTSNEVRECYKQEKLDFEP